MLAFSSIIAAQKPGSCEKDGTTYCDKQSPDGCYCDTKQFNDYCTDIDSVCDQTITTPTPYPQPTPKPSDGSCQGYCGEKSSAGCWCDTACTGIGDCCDDYQSVCKGGTPTPYPYPQPYPTFSFRNSEWECYDGFNEIQGGPTSCKSNEVWKSYAEEACANRCSKETGKCGVNSFKVENVCAEGTTPTPEKPTCSDIKDSVCPSACAAGADYDCCVNKGYEWFSGKGCYSKVN